MVINGKKNNLLKFIIMGKKAYISKQKWAKDKLEATILFGAFSAICYFFYCLSGGFWAVIVGILTVPLAIVYGVFAFIYLCKYIEIMKIPDEEWADYINKQRILLSLAIYKHPMTGDVRTVRRGFSLPVFLFGGFVPLFKGQYELAFKFFALLIGLDIIGGIFPGIGTIIFHNVGAFSIARKYNGYYENWLVEKGYQLVDAHGIADDYSNMKSKVNNMLNS